MLENLISAGCLDLVRRPGLASAGLLPLIAVSEGHGVIKSRQTGRQRGFPDESVSGRMDGSSVSGPFALSLARRGATTSGGRS